MGRRIRRAYLKKRTHTYMKGGIGFFHANVTRHSTDTVDQSEVRQPGQVKLNHSNQLEKLWQGDFWQGVQRFNKLVIIHTSKEKIVRYFSGKANIFVREDFVLKVTQRSIEYKDKDQAMRYYNLGNITWVECFKSSFSSSSPLPP